jgi:hypothetical protein
VRFFQHQSHALIGNHIEVAQFDQAVGNHLHRPTGLSCRRLRAGNGRDVGFFALRNLLGLPTARCLMQRPFQAASSVAALDIVHSSTADAKTLSKGRAVERGIGAVEQDQRTFDFTGRADAFAREVK